MFSGGSLHGALRGWEHLEAERDGSGDNDKVQNALELKTANSFISANTFVYLTDVGRITTEVKIHSVKDYFVEFLIGCLRQNGTRASS